MRWTPRHQRDRAGAAGRHQPAGPAQRRRARSAARRHSPLGGGGRSDRRSLLRLAGAPLRQPRHLPRPRLRHPRQPQPEGRFSARHPLSAADQRRHRIRGWSWPGIGIVSSSRGSLPSGRRTRPSMRSWQPACAPSARSPRPPRSIRWRYICGVPNRRRRSCTTRSSVARSPSMRRWTRWSTARKDVEAPLPYANAELARQNDAIVADYLARTAAPDRSRIASTPSWSSTCRTAGRRRRASRSACA